MARLQLNLPSLRGAAAYLTVVMIGASVLAAVVKPAQPYLLLVPGAVFGNFLLWQPLTFAFVETSPLGVIFGAIIIWSIGGALERLWGTKRFLWFALGNTVLAGLATVGLSYGWTALQDRGFAGGAVLSGALWVAYGLSIGPRQANFWGMPVTGNVLALIGAGFVFLTAAFQGVQVVVPDAFALLFTFLYVRGARPGDLWTRFRSWLLERDLKKRSSRLKVVGGEERNTPRDSDKYLH